MGEEYDGAEDPDVFSGKIMGGDQDEQYFDQGCTPEEVKRGHELLAEAGYTLSNDP